MQRKGCTQQIVGVRRPNERYKMKTRDDRPSAKGKFSPSGDEIVPQLGAIRVHSHWCGDAPGRDMNLCLDEACVRL